MFKTKFYIFLIVGFISFCTLHGQGNGQKIPISKLLENITKTHNITFNYESSLLKDIKVLPISKELDLSAKIDHLEKQTDLVFNRISNTVFSISKSIRLCGYIKDMQSQQPVSGVTINSKSVYDITDEKGYFEIKLSSLNDLVTIRHVGFQTIERKVKDFNVKHCATINMFEQLEEITPVLLETYLVRGIDKRKDWTTSIDYSKFSLLPGLIESDVLQTVQALPGILSVDETVSNINIRGGSHDQNLILWDGIKMYQTGHFFGLISSFNPSMTQTASVTTNGSDVSLTDGISGTIHMQTNKKINSEFKGSFGLNLLNAEIFTNIPIGTTSSLQIASRKSLDEFVRTPTYDIYYDRIIQATEVQNNVSEVTNSDQEFNFYDTSLRWLYNPTEKDQIQFNFILMDNDLGFNETTNINSSIRTRRSHISQKSIALGLNYRRKWNDNLFTTFHIYETDYKLRSINADVLSEQIFLQENIVSETSLTFENTYIKDLWRFKSGYSFTETEVINLNDIDLPRFVRRDEEVLREHGVYGQALFHNAENDLSIRGGVRANYLTKFKKLIVEPRLSVRKSIGDHIDIEVLGEFKHQSTSQIVNFQNDFLGIEKRRWQLTDNDTIPIMQSKQASIGMLYKKKGWLLDAKTYYKEVEGITTQSQSFTTKYEFTKEKGDYGVYGFEFLLRKTFQKFNTWLSYAYMNNTYTFENLQEIEFPSNFDITNSITLGSTYSNENLHISAGINYRSGKPTSIPLLGNEIINNTVNFDTANTDRLRDYFRIDASATYTFKLNNRFRSEIGVSVWNISDQENAINNYFRVNEDAANKFSRFSLGITSNAVFRLYF